MIGINGEKQKSAFIILCTIAATLLLYSIGMASGGGEAGGSGDSGKIVDLIYRCLNFALMVIILFIIIRKTSIKDFFSSRREEISQKFTDLNREKEEAEKRSNDLEKRLKEFELKEKEIIEQYKAEGAVEKEKIIAEAKKRAKDILDQVDLTIQREIQEAKERLKQEVVDSAAKKAEEIIAKNIKASDQDHLVNEFIKKVEKLH